LKSPVVVPIYVIMHYYYMVLFTHILPD